MFLSVFASLSLIACVESEDPDAIEATTSALSSTSWTAPVSADHELRDGHDVSYPPAMAMLDGVEYYVYASGTNLNPFGDLSHDLYWHQCDGTTCTDSRAIPGQKSLGRVSLAAFNGSIYMVHQGDTDDTAVWFTKLNPATGTWTTNDKLAFSTIGGSPALAVFENKLYMVGSREVEVVRRGGTAITYPLWYATMGANDVWSTATAIASESASPPSLAVLGSRLYLAHQNGTRSDIVLQSKPAGGGGWTAPARIMAGPNNTAIEGDDVQLAAVNGYLHLVHQRWSGGLTYWTYNRGCDAWAPEISLGTFQSVSASSLATGINGLVLTRLTETGLWPYTVYHWYKTRYLAPPPPMTLPNCGAI